MTSGLVGVRHGSGAFRRRIIVEAVDEGRVLGALEDEMHHFEVELVHRDGVVTEVRGDGRRVPWRTCGDAPVALRALEGLPLPARLRDVRAGADPRQQCTHLFDLVSIAARQASRGGQRQYDATVPDAAGSPTRATLALDGQTVLEWVLDELVVRAPEAWAGRPLMGGFAAWCEQNLAPDEAEAALVLQRAVWMSAARRLDLEACRDVRESGLPDAVCFTSQPERIDRALRNRGSLRDYGPGTGDMIRKVRGE